MLVAGTLLPKTTSLLNVAYLADGLATSHIVRALPSCFTTYQFGNFLELYNVNNGMVFGRHGPFDNAATGSHFSTFAGWNTTLYPVLNTSLTGLYRCRTDTDQSLATYELYVRGKIFGISYKIFLTITWHYIDNIDHCSYRENQVGKLPSRTTKVRTRNFLLTMQMR